jgi:hypothetical protein
MRGAFSTLPHKYSLRHLIEHSDKFILLSPPLSSSVLCLLGKLSWQGKQPMDLDGGI